jgi:protein-tyrosine phosphatase/tRNA uridine 5-carbamoylmethylation protein Kti12
MFSKTKGCLYLLINKEHIQKVLNELNLTIPVEWENQRFKRDGDKYHITVVPKKNFRDELDYPNDLNFYIVGIVFKKDLAFLVCFYPAGISFCLKNNLPITPFHITLGFKSKDNHEIPKDYTQITSYKHMYLKDFILLLKDINMSLSLSDADASKHLSIKTLDFDNLFKHFSNIIEDPDLLRDLRKTYCKYLFKKNDPVILKNQLLLMLQEDKENAAYSLIKLDMIDHPDQLDIEEHSIQDMSKAIKLVGLLNRKFFTNRMKYAILDGKIKNVKIPTNFSKITPNVYASGLVNSSHLPFIQSLGITSIINLTEDDKSSIKNNIDYHHFPIIDGQATDFETIDKIVNLIARKDQTTLVHCLGGKGRTAMAFYSYLIREEGMSISEIDQKYRTEREVIMTDVQLEFIRNFTKNPYGHYYNHIKHKGSSTPKALILVGIPGSGKSTFSTHLEKYLKNDMVYLNQDIQGRKELSKEIFKNSKNKKLVIVDRCNLTRQERDEWNCYFKDSVWCICFDMPPEECFFRVEHRKGHPTLSGLGGVKIAKEMLIKIETPGFDEGFEQIISITSEEDLNHLLSTWKMKPIQISAEDNFFKFPRTVHLYNLGSASRDDLLLDKQKQLEFLNTTIHVEEKIDGANMGISINLTDLSLCFQNRSHFINSKYHFQFEKLDAWRDEHAADLFQIIEPGRHILFGEWLYSQHSIPYKKLPGYFIAFDLYDRKEKKFYSRTRLEKILQNTSIHLVRCIKVGEFKKLQDLVDLIKTTSQYRGDGGQVEGVYVKQSDDGEWITRRGKIVREDFIGGNKFWAKGIVEKNQIDCNIVY